ncbi:MAG: Ig-like domain-containing protein [Planctomycetota bacterium]|nr:Ig-like domain-containing protein [Planctomycetota bacterium]MDP6761569.1 Ig-like domain-containing protein [Planctomycetota bacterium]
MRSPYLTGLAAALCLPALTLFSACSAGDAGLSVGGAMYVESCSLGCANGSDGAQIGCSIVNVGRNVEITLLFSEEVDLSSVNSSSFRIINTTNGSVPVGTYALDPDDARRLIFRPALTFDEVGNPLFALEEDATYEVLIPGENQGDSGPYVQSVGGRRNTSRLQCTIRTTEGLLDPVPGAPVFTARIEVRDGSGGVVQVFDPADGAVDVPVFDPSVDSEYTVVVVEFDDIMNPATLTNLSTGQSSTITVKIDPDGNTVDPTDQVDQAGIFSVEVDFESLRTSLVFTPTGGFPSAGDDPLNPRRIIMALPGGLLDLVGNELANPGEVVFSTVIVPFDPIVLPDDDGENFTDDSNHDVARSGADWGGGLLSYGAGGGSGRHGELVVPSGLSVTIRTGNEDFPMAGLMVRDLLDNAIPEVDYDPLDSGTWPTLNVGDGAFEFSRIEVEPNANLFFIGPHPPRIFSRGELVVAGTVHVEGTSAPPHRSNTGGENTTDPSPDAQLSAAGGTPGTNGPAGGAGGRGAARFDHTDSQLPPMTNVGGIQNPTFNPGNIRLDGEGGVGIGGTGHGAGQGGVHWPSTMPTCINIAAPCTPPHEFGDAEFSPVVNPNTGATECRVAQVAGPGSGGGYALVGEAGRPSSPHTPSDPGVNSNIPANTPGGDPSALGIEAPGSVAIRALSYTLGHLRGGSGGGGGGCHMYGSYAAQGTEFDCATGNIFPYFDHSGAGGGGGGGAIQLTSGKRITLTGIIDASGGDGGSATGFTNPITQCTETNEDYNCEEFAAPGGGGSGGAVKLQALVVDVASLPGRVNVAGGAGGVGVGGSLGGDASPGLIRIEFYGGPSAANQGDHAGEFAPWIAPYDPDDLDPGGFNDPFDSAAILSVGAWGAFASGAPIVQRFRPASFSAGASCWMQPQGNFFELSFKGDNSETPDDPTAPDSKGWNMEVLYDTGPNGVKAFPYRGQPLSSDSDYPFDPGDGSNPGMDFETFLGQLINHDEAEGEGSLFAVRFQGARATGVPTDLCDVELAGFDSEIQPGSLTPNVRHPEDLNLFVPRPNMVRFTVVFEEFLRSQGPIQNSIVGVTNLKIGVQPN